MVKLNESNKVNIGSYDNNYFLPTEIFFFLVGGVKKAENANASSGICSAVAPDTINSSTAPPSGEIFAKTLGPILQRAKNVLIFFKPNNNTHL